PWCLVHLETHAVPETVTEQVAVTAPLNVATSDGIGIPTRHAGPYLAGRALVPCATHFIDFTLLVARMAKTHGSRDVCAVPAGLGPEVEQQEIAAPNRRGRGTRMRQRRPRPAAADRRKGKALAAEVSKRSLEQSSDLELGHAGVHFGQRSLQRARRDRRRPPDEGDLLGILAFAQRLDQVEGRPPLPARPGFHQALKVAMQKMRRFETSDLQLRESAKVMPEARPETLRLDDDTGDIPDLGACLRLIAKVRDQDRVAWRHEHQRVRARETSQVPDVGEACDQQTIDVRSR